ncbi:MAG: class B sortase [Clostridiales bacterium]|nr:class B sortase [Clostridiales bacterium]
MRVFLYRVAVAAIIAAMLVCAYQLYSIQRKYDLEASVHDRLLEYKPPTPDELAGLRKDGGSLEGDASTDSMAALSNSAIIEAREKINPDIVGWITIPETNIDYPFVQGADNEFYLTHDTEKKKSAAGSIFIDIRNDEPFKGFNTILYGHHMKNGSMFGALANYAESAFFRNNSKGLIYLEEEVYEMLIFACLVIHPDDGMIYNSLNLDSKSKTEYLDYVKRNAKNYQDAALEPSDKIITLSTCAYDFNDARMAVLAKIQKLSI